jgi:FKBP-type peptidyl-prolyl cis-trans isomerase
MQRLLVLSLLIVLSLAGMATAQQAPLQSDQSATPEAAQAATSPSDQSPQQVLGYALGFNIGSNLRTNKADADVESLMAGVSDGLRGVPPKISEAERTAALQRFQQQLQKQVLAEAERRGEVNKQKGEAFLAQNRKQQGVQVTPSGLQYKVLKKGTGPSPNVNDIVRCHYRGTLMDGTEFDSSYGGEPAEFKVSGVIPGWTEALQKMHVGDKWQLWIPADLAYGLRSPAPAIEPNSLLIFDVELLEIVKP